MMKQAQATFAVTGWTEKTWDNRPAGEVTGEKLTRAMVSYSYDGDIQGKSEVQFLMVYMGETSGSYVGLERIEGTLAGCRGSFVLRHSGTFHGDVVDGTVEVLAGCGTGELKTLRGQGGYDLVGTQKRYPFFLDYEIEEPA